MKAISIRQPWAWLIVRPDLAGLARDRAQQTHSIKPVENRVWSTAYRGPILIHAAQGMTKADYASCSIFLESDARLMHLCAALPPFDWLQRGGIVGQGSLLACVSEHESPFFCGPFGHVYVDVRPVKFQPLKGALGYFDVPANALEPVEAL